MVVMDPYNAFEVVFPIVGKAQEVPLNIDLDQESNIDLDQKSKVGVVSRYATTQSVGGELPVHVYPIKVVLSQPSYQRIDEDRARRS